MSANNLNVEVLQQELREALAAVREATDPRTRALRHRDVAYSAMYLNLSTLAMTHAVVSLDIARGTQDRPLQAKAHVTIALVMAEVYDDQGASAHFGHAEEISRECGDARGVALAAVNAAHYEMEREQYAPAAQRLLGLLRSPERAGLLIDDPAVGPRLQQPFDINLVKSVSGALLLGEGFGDDGAEVCQATQASVGRLRDLLEGREDLIAPHLHLDVLDALSAHAETNGDTALARGYSDERVSLAQRAGILDAAGRALLDRGHFAARQGAWAQATADATEAAQKFEVVGHEVRAVAAHQLLADALAKLGRYQEAFEVQRTLTARATGMYRAYFQQGAQLRLIEQQAHEAERRAASFAAAALRDPLTGIPNRAAAMEQLEHLHREARRGVPSAAAILDLDHFKSVNDRYGHAAGDAVLQRFASTVQGLLADGQTVARLGGEEFVILFPGLEVAGASAACEGIREALSGLSWPDISPELRVTASIGVTAVKAGGTPGDTLRDADVAMYEAKRGGRHAVVTARPSCLS